MPGFSCYSYLEQLVDDLILAAERDDVGTIARLLSLGVSPDARGSGKKTPLHYAALSNNTEMAQLLLQHNGNIEARDEENQTPLHNAALQNSTEVAQLLLKHNADIKARALEIKRLFTMLH